jgi:hypothetical protein
MVQQPILKNKMQNLLLLGKGTGDISFPDLIKKMA